MNSSIRRFALTLAGVACWGGATVASAAIVSPLGPGALDLLMGTPLLAVPDDGSPVGTLYGHPPSFTPGMPLATPIGFMGFGPTHDRVTAGTPFSSGFFHAIPGPAGPIAGSTVYAPGGCTAIDFFLGLAPGSPPPYTFEITAIGTVTSKTISVIVGGAPVYVGFGAFGESIVAISIVKTPFPSPTIFTWEVGDIRVLPSPGAAGLIGLGCVIIGRRRRASTV